MLLRKVFVLLRIPEGFLLLSKVLCYFVSFLCYFGRFCVTLEGFVLLRKVFVLLRKVLCYFVRFLCYLGRFFVTS